jgi:hypothetical protein
MKRLAAGLVILLAAALAACQWLPKLGSRKADASPAPSSAVASPSAEATPAGDAAPSPEQPATAGAAAPAEAAPVPAEAPEATPGRSASSTRPSTSPRRVAAAGPSAAAAAAPAPDPTAATEREEPAPAPPAPTPEPVLVPAGTALPIELHQTLASDRSRSEDAVSAEIAEDVIVDGRVVLPAGTEVLGHVVVARQSGRVKGRARLVVDFEDVRLDGKTYEIDVPRWDITAASGRDKDAKIAGGAAAAGALIGALAGGGKGAVRGGLIGGAAGGAAVLATRGNEVELRAGARHRITLRTPLVLD